MEPETPDEEPTPARRRLRGLIVGSATAVILLGAAAVFFAWPADDSTPTARDTDNKRVVEDGDPDGAVEVREFGHTANSGRVSWAAIVENTSPEHKVRVDYNLFGGGELASGDVLVIPPQIPPWALAVARTCARTNCLMCHSKWMTKNGPAPGRTTRNRRSVT